MISNKPTQARRWRVLDLRRGGMTYAAIVEAIRAEYDIPKYALTQVWRDLQTAQGQENEVIYNRGPQAVEYILENIYSHHYA